MKSRSTVICALGLLALLAGCSGVSVNYDYDQEAAFDSYRTYEWLGSQAGSERNAPVGMFDSELFDRRVHEAVDREMANHNVTMSENADLLVKYYIGLEDKIQVTDWGYRYADQWGRHGRHLDVVQYTRGMLIIDLVDAASKTLVWRGTATGAVDEQQRSPEKIQARVNRVVAEVFSNYPPR